MSRKRIKYECEENTNDIYVSTPNRLLFVCLYVLMTTNDYI